MNRSEAWTLVLEREAGHLPQSSLSERVSYCSDRSGGSLSQARVGATGPEAQPCGCCWDCMEGDEQAMEVGGVLLSMRMVRGL